MRKNLSEKVITFNFQSGLYCKTKGMLLEYIYHVVASFTGLGRGGATVFWRIRSYVKSL